MAYRKKANFILAHKPDILIVPECEHPDKLKFNSGTPIPSDILWYGTNQHKGLAIFSYSKCKFQLLDIHNCDIKTILPIAVTGGPVDFTLFAIWAYNPQDRGYIYIGQIWKAIKCYESLLENKNIILAGDFNSNAIWDKPRRKISHAMLVEKLASHDIFSAYHTHRNLAHGVEKHPTYFMYRHKNRPYHMDYCFVSRSFIDKLENVEIGTHKRWAKHSDHSPVIVSFKV